MNSYAKDYKKYPNFEIDYAKMSVWADNTTGCEWSIESVNLN